MANHASAAKRNRQRIKRTARNKAVRRSVRTAVTKARAALANGDAETAQQRVKVAAVALARAASKGIIHHNAASRTTSRIETALAKLAKS